jgi:predicted RNase H-like HicB family nuclease
MEYIAYLHKDRKSDFGVSFPDFPGCITAGETFEESGRNEEEALALHISGMLEDGEMMPEPSTLDDIANDPAMKKCRGNSRARRFRKESPGEYNRERDPNRQNRPAGRRSRRPAYFVRKAQDGRGKSKGTVARRSSRRAGK